MLSRNFRLKKEAEFRRIYRKGKNIRGFFFDFSYLPNYKCSRFGIVVTTKTISKSTQRNKAKRVLRGMIGKNRNFWPRHVDIIIRIKKEIKNEEKSEAENELKSLFDKIISK